MLNNRHVKRINRRNISRHSHLEVDVMSQDMANKDVAFVYFPKREIHNQHERLQFFTFFTFERSQSISSGDHLAPFDLSGDTATFSLGGR